jgi:hypothetical protein
MGWTQKRLTCVAILIFGGQLAAIFALHTRESLRAKIPPLTASRFNGFATNSVGSDLDDLNDPLTFAGAHEKGFSAHAWLKRPHMEFTLRSNSISPPTFLAFKQTPIEIPNPKLFPGLPPQLPFARLSISNETSPQSTFWAQGTIASRPLLTRIEPPIQFGSDVISNTVVQVAVQPDGFPFTARIVATSGSRGADLTALQLANNARFTPLPPAQRHTDTLQWGELVFQWHTAPTPSTNAPATPPK